MGRLQGSTEDSDDDNDLLSDIQESIIGTNSIADTDGDGFRLPLDDLEWLDTDNDGQGDNSDTDDDDDGWSDVLEDICATDPLDDNSLPPDYDNDGEIPMIGMDDQFDDYPYDAGITTDTDGDGHLTRYTLVTMACKDLDDDNDGWSGFEEGA